MMRLIVTCKKEKDGGLGIGIENDSTCEMESVEELLALMHARAYLGEALDSLKKKGPDIEKILSLMEEEEREAFMSYISHKSVEELKKRGTPLSEVLKNAEDKKRKRDDSTPPDWVQEELDRIEAEMEKEKVENERR